MARKGIWGFLRGLGRRKASVTAQPSHVVVAELRPAPPADPGAEGGVDNSASTAGPPPEGGGEALKEAISRCVDRYLRPALLCLNGDDSLVQSPTSRAVLVALAGYWLLAACSSLVLLVAALAVPAVRSARALESGDRRQRRRWLSYWAVYGAVGAVSAVSDPLHGLIPGYWTAKTMLLMWCAAPYPWHGSDYVLHQLIVPGGQQLAATFRDCFVTARTEQ